MKDLTRRDVLKAGAAASIAVMAGWRLPGLGNVALQQGPIPEDASEVVMAWGNIVAYSDGFAAEQESHEALMEFITDRLRGSMPSPPEYDGWIGVECLEEKVYHAPAGHDFDDPLSLARVGLKQQWRMVRA